jgi:hypothetical protein
MDEIMPLEKCKTCKNHIMYEQGYVMCDFHKIQEQRMTEKKNKDMIYIVNCPKRVDVKR